MYDLLHIKLILQLREDRKNDLFYNIGDLGLNGK